MRLTTLGTALAIVGAAHAVVNSRLLRRPEPVGAGDGRVSRVSVLVPARDEGNRIGACLAHLVGQAGAEILVLDDESSDDTGDVVAAAAMRDPRIRLLHGAALPPGWLGKPHACAQLAAAADPASSVLIFLDADVELDPTAVARATALLDSTGLDLVSPYPRQVAESVAERLVQPLLQWSWLTFLPLRLAERSARPSLSAANGQFLVVRRSTYERAGGHRAVRGDVLDDLALLRAVKSVGGRGGVVDGTDLAQCRMYRGWSELRDGYAKSLWSAFGSPPGALAVLAGLGLGYVVPAFAALRGSRIGLLGYGAGVVGGAVTARRCGARVWPDALLHPTSVLVFGYLTGRSVLLRRLGGLEWKQRPV